MNRLAKFWRGDVPLKKAFWYYGVGGLALILALFIAQMVYNAYALYEGLSQRPIPGSFTGIPWFWLLIGAVTLAYVVTVPVGIWRSASRHEGKLALFSSFFARVLSIGLAICVALIYVSLTPGALGGLAQHDLNDIMDADRNSRNAAQRIRRDPKYPFVGYWQKACGDPEGLVIEHNIERPWWRDYRFEMCWANGCQRWGADSNLINDQHYRIIDRDTLDVLEQFPNTYARYLRCR